MLQLNVHTTIVRRFRPVSRRLSLLTVALVLLALASPGRALAQEEEVVPTQPSNGDVNGDLRLDIGDAVFLLIHLFSGGEAPVPIVCETRTDCEDGPLPSEETGIYIVESLQLTFDAFEEHLERYEINPFRFDYAALLETVKDVVRITQLYESYHARIARAGVIEDFRDHVLGFKYWAQDLDGILAFMGRIVGEDLVLAYEISNARNSLIMLQGQVDLLIEEGSTAKGCSYRAGVCPRPCAVTCTQPMAQVCLDAGCHFEVRYDEKTGGCKVFCIP